MCGRYTRRKAVEVMYEYFGIPHPWPDFSDTRLTPSFNIAPQSFQPVIRPNDETGQREVVIMRWGLVPFWSKDGKAGFNTINAKAETVATSPMFREPFKRRRCLIPADAFYEWKKLDAKMKQPHAIGLKSDSPFAFAGLWETWKSRDGATVQQTYTIITTDPNELMQGLHDRMPVILKPKDYDRWMAAADPSQLPVDLLKPYPAEEMTAWPVS